MKTIRGLVIGHNFAMTVFVSAVKSCFQMLQKKTLFFLILKTESIVLNAILQWNQAIKEGLAIQIPLYLNDLKSSNNLYLIKTGYNTDNKINRLPAARDKLSQFLQTVPAFLTDK